MTVPRKRWNHRDSSADVLVRDRPLWAREASTPKMKMKKRIGYRHREQAQKQHRNQHQLSPAGAVEDLSHERLDNAVEQDAQGEGGGNRDAVPAELFAHGIDEGPEAVAGAHGGEPDEDRRRDDVPAEENRASRGGISAHSSPPHPECGLRRNLRTLIIPPALGRCPAGYFNSPSPLRERVWVRVKSQASATLPAVFWIPVFAGMTG